MMRAWTKATAVGLILSSSALSSAASAQGYSASRVVDAMDDGILIATLDEIGLEWEVGDSSSNFGTIVYNVEFASGLLAFAYLHACEPSCKGLVLLAGFNRPTGVSDTDLAERIRTFNDSHVAGKGFLGQGGSPMVQWYVNADGGISLANLRSQIEQFGETGYEFSEAIY